MFIALGGYGRAGKDTVADYLHETHGFTKVAFADPMRDAARILNPLVRHVSRSGDERVLPYADLVADIGYERAKDESPDVRPFLERLGTDVGRRMFGENVWVDRAVQTARRIRGHVVFTDTRFPNELAAAKQLDAQTIWVRRPGIVPSMHVSGTALDRPDFDWSLDNDGDLDQLHERIDDLMKDLPW